jgi:hypothetical protein
MPEMTSDRYSTTRYAQDEMRTTGKGLRGTGIRFADQGLWSLASFALNLSASLTLAVGDYSALCIATAVAFVCIAGLRPWSVVSRIVAGARMGISPGNSIDLESGLWSSFIAGMATYALVASCLVLSNGASPVWIPALLSMLIVLADFPRQYLLFQSHHISSAVLSMAYACLGLLTLMLYHGGVGGLYPVVAWIASAAVVVVLGYSFALRYKRNVELKRDNLRGVSWRHAAEGVYVAFGSQAALFILFAVDADQSVAGIRLNYSLVFAPALLMIQALMPLVNMRLARSWLSGKGTASDVSMWLVGFTGLVLGCGLAGIVGVTLLPGTSTFREVIPFMLPVGLAILGAQVQEVVTCAFRFSVRARILLRIRVAVVLLDIGGQIAGLYLGGVGGLGVALALIGAVRCITFLGAYLVSRQLPERNARVRAAGSAATMESTGTPREVGNAH